MKDFNLESCLDGIYSSFPEANPLPMIGLTADYSDIDATIRSVYYKQVVAAGGIPVLIPPVADEDVLTGTLEHLDGLILTGGGDLNPLWYGEEPSPQLHHINKERDLAELLITRLAYNRQIPILGICRGIQTLTIALGGKITQDINQKIKHDQNADRREPLTLIGPKGLERVVSCLRVIAPELPFPIIYQEIQGAEQTFELNGYRLKAFRVNHNVLCYGYTIEIDRAGKFDVERARANEIPQKYWSRLQNGETVESEMGILTPDMVLGPQRKGIKLTYTTDTRPTDSIRENAKDSDLFICEGMYGEKEKAAKAVEYKHMTFYEAAELAKEANVGEMWLTHYSPSLTKPEHYMNDVKKIFPRAKAGKDGMSVDLMFED